MTLLTRACVRVMPLLAAVLLAVPALAQDDEEKLPPYDVPGIEHSGVWIPWVFAFLFTVACIFVGFKNPHRGHMD